MIERFVDAQRDVYDKALAEISSGKKLTHWMWFIFPQIIGLGNSRASIFFSIKDLQEAKEYLNHPLLGDRLREITEALLKLEENNPVKIFGFTDALKLCSSMTLFDILEPESLFDRVLMKYFGGKRDEKTMKILSEQKCPTNDTIFKI